MTHNTRHIEKGEHMTDKKLKKLSRKELLDVMLAQGEEIDRLKAQLEEANRKLSEREIIMKESGTLAEAALKLNNIFKDADEACRQYIDSIKKMSETHEEKKAETSTNKETHKLRKHHVSAGRKKENEE
jgi:hypothetical protein